MLVRTQVERWLEKNRSQLKQAQIEMLDEAIEFITPDKYEFDKDRKKVEQETTQFSKRIEKLFSREEMRQTLNIRLDCIPPVDSENS